MLYTEDFSKHHYVRFFKIGLQMFSVVSSINFTSPYDKAQYKWSGKNLINLTSSATPDVNGY